MRVPSFVGIAKHKVQLAAASDHKQICENYATGLHPNPYLYKYYWWVFWSQSPVDGLAFLDKAYRLNTAEASRLCEKLASLNEPFWRYNCHLPRYTPCTPFDRNHDRWRACEWASPYEDDTDEIWLSPWGTTYK